MLQIVQKTVELKSLSAKGCQSQPSPQQQTSNKNKTDI